MFQLHRPGEGIKEKEKINRAEGMVLPLSRRQRTFHMKIKQINRDESLRRLRNRKRNEMSMCIEFVHVWVCVSCYFFLMSFALF